MFVLFLFFHRPGAAVIVTKSYNEEGLIKLIADVLLYKYLVGREEGEGHG